MAAQLSPLMMSNHHLQNHQSSFCSENLPEELTTQFKASKSVEPTQKYNSHACDNCSISKRKCSRTLPSCSNCSRLSKCCSYDRPKLRARALPTHKPEKIKKYQSVFQIKDKPIIMEQVKKSNWKCTQSVGQEFVVPIVKSNSQDNLQTHVLYSNINSVENKLVQSNKTVMADFISKSMLNCPMLRYLVAMLDFHPTRKNQDPGKFGLLISLVHATKPFALTNIQAHPPSPTPELVISNIDSELLTLGIDAYFKYKNPFYPIFYPSDFFQRQRSPLLLLTVAAIGLQFLPETNALKAQLDSICRLIVSSVKKHLHKTQHNLDFLQTLMLVRLGLNTHPLIFPIVNLTKFALDPIATSLGLHRSSPSLLKGDYRLILERRLTFNTLSFMIQGNLVALKQAYTFNTENSSLLPPPYQTKLPKQDTGNFLLVKNYVQLPKSSPIGCISNYLAFYTVASCEFYKIYNLAHRENADLSYIPAALESYQNWLKKSTEIWIQQFPAHFDVKDPSHQVRYHGEMLFLNLWMSSIELQKFCQIGLGKPAGAYDKKLQATCTAIIYNNCFQFGITPANPERLYILNQATITLLKLHPALVEPTSSSNVSVLKIMENYNQKMLTVQATAGILYLNLMVQSQLKELFQMEV